MLGEADGLVILDWRSFWMGHSGNIEFVYTPRKGPEEGLTERKPPSLLFLDKNGQTREVTPKPRADRSGKVGPLVRN